MRRLHAGDFSNGNKDLTKQGSASGCSAHPPEAPRRGTTHLRQESGLAKTGEIMEALDRQNEIFHDLPDMQTRRFRRVLRLVLGFAASQKQRRGRRGFPRSAQVWNMIGAGQLRRSGPCRAVPCTTTP